MPGDNDGYFRNPRPEMLEFIPDEASVLLEVGCGTGAFARSLKELRARAGRPVEIWGVEVDEKAARLAGENLDRVIEGDVAAAGAELPAGHFD